MLHNVTILHSIPSLLLSPLLTFFACTNKEFKRIAWSRYGYRSNMKEIGLVLIYLVAVVYSLFYFFPLVNHIPIPPPTPISMISLIIIHCGPFTQLPIHAGCIFFPALAFCFTLTCGRMYLLVEAGPKMLSQHTTPSILFHQKEMIFTRGTPFNHLMVADMAAQQACSLPRQLNNNCLESVWDTMTLFFMPQLI